MYKNSIDYSSLENKIYKKAYRLEDVKDKIEKVAFDIVRFKDDDKGANLWQVQSADDGQYIVALYEDSELAKTSSPWEVSVSKTANEVYFFYKNDPIVKLNASKLGIPKEELSNIGNYLPEKLAANKKLVNSLLNELTVSAKKEVLNKYPELL